MNLMIASASKKVGVHIGRKKKIGPGVLWHTCQPMEIKIYQYYYRSE